MTLRRTIRILATITTMMNYIISITVIIPTNLTNHKHDNVIQILLTQLPLLLLLLIIIIQTSIMIKEYT